MSEDGGLPRKDGNFRQLVFDPPAGLPTSLFGLCSGAMLAVFEVGWAVREEVSGQEEKLDGGEDSPVYFGCHHLQGSYVLSCNRLRAHADA